MAHLNGENNESDANHLDRDIAREYWDAEDRQRGLFILLTFLALYSLDYVMSGEVAAQITEAVAALGHGDPLPAAETLTEIGATVLAFAWTLKEIRTSRVEVRELEDEYLNPPDISDLEAEE